jgi:hypothetical protein
LAKPRRRPYVRSGGDLAYLLGGGVRDDPAVSVEHKPPQFYPFFSVWGDQQLS